LQTHEILTLAGIAATGVIKFRLTGWSTCAKIWLLWRFWPLHPKPTLIGMTTNGITLAKQFAGVGLLNLVHEFVFGCVERGRVYDATVIRWWQALIAVTDYSVWTTK
jgi:hypothetical protein